MTMSQITCIFGQSTGCFLIFCKLTFELFLNPQMEDPNQEKGSKFGSRIEISNPKTSQRGLFRPKKGSPKRGPFRFLGDAGAPMLAASLVHRYTHAHTCTHMHTHTYTHIHPHTHPHTCKHNTSNDPFSRCKSVQ